MALAYCSTAQLLQRPPLRLTGAPERHPGPSARWATRVTLLPLHTRPSVVPPSLPAPPVAGRASGVAVVWLRTELRLRDHPALHAALATRPRAVLFLVVCDLAAPRDPVDGRLLDSPRAQFLRSAVCALRRSLRALGSDLAVVPPAGANHGALRDSARDDNEATAVASTCETVRADALFFIQGVSSRERAVERRVANALAASAKATRGPRGPAAVHPVWGNALHDLPGDTSAIPVDDCDAFARYMTRTGRVAAPLAAPKELPPTPPLPDGHGVEVRDDAGARGGEEEALQRLNSFLSGEAPLVDSPRPPLDFPFGKLNYFLEWGCLSPRDVLGRLRDQLPSTSLRRHCAEYELMLRDFFRFATLRHGAVPA